MTISRIALFTLALLVGAGSLAGSDEQPAAGPAELLWGKSYLECLKRARAAAEVAPGRYDEATFDRGRRQCNSTHATGRPGG